MFSSANVPALRSASLGGDAPAEGVERSARGILGRIIAEVCPAIRVDKRQAWNFALSISSLLITIYALFCLESPLGGAATRTATKLLITLLSCGACIACGACVLTRRDAERSWRLGCLIFGLGWAFNAAGANVWDVSEIWHYHSRPNFSMADGLFILSELSLLVGLVLIYWSASPVRRALNTLDSGLLTSVFGALAYFFIFQPVWMARDKEAPIETWVALFYPLFDILLLWGALALAYVPLSSRGRNRAGIVVAFAMAMFVFTHLWYAYLSVNGRYPTGGWSNLAVGVSYSFVTLGMLAMAWERARSESEAEERELLAAEVLAGEDGGSMANAEISLQRLLLPYIVAVFAFGLIAVQQWRTTGTLGLDVLAWCVVFLCIFMARQMKSLAENVRLARQLRELNVGLDKQVSARNRQMDALLQLTKAVNASMVESEVLSHAVDSARRAVPMSVFAVWNWDENDDSTKLAVAEGAFPGTTSPTPSAGVYEVLSSERLSQMTRQVACSGKAIDDCGDELKFLVPQQGLKKLVPALHLEPILFNGRVLGVLGAFRFASAANNAAFTAEESRILENVGLEVGTALENARIYSRAVEAADCDPATGLLNHSTIQLRLDTAWERSQKQRTPLSVVLMDLNNFKNFNDVYGHLVGDEVLRLVARVLTETCRGEDVVARYGGDEFFMLLPDTDATGAFRVAQRLQNHMKQVEFRPDGAHEALPIELSFGVATAPDDAHSKADLLAVAERNLYVAKGSSEAIHCTSSTRQKRLAMLSADGVAALNAMVTAVSNADAYTRQHSEDVTDYALWIAEELGLDEDTRRTIEMGGMLHDVGKICVPQDVLKKPGRLTEAEFAAMQTHPAMGALLVNAVLPDAGVLQIVRSHHERYDGRGYPDALAGEDIPLLGRLVAVADAFSAMTTSRPYRKALSLEQARHEIERGIGTQFDPKMAEAFIRALDKRNAAP